ncbi:NmrA family NAD(P)-binding protein [Sorangium sp. So ce131]|uniref:NmrA family NAD(P)-binding protein n=1 Tax=Sorangium sp. So ce131 TaxID=3133282 RepID=UPI003F5FB093
MVSNGVVLVTGASGGQQGKTGRYVTEMLRARGIPVRAFVRRLDERSDHLRALGAEVVVGDLLDVQSVERAVQGVSSVYFAYPVEAGLLDATAIMAVAARKAGVSRLIDMVMLVSSPDAPSPRMRQNYVSEQIFEQAGVGAAHIRATVFYENVRALVRSSLATQGKILLPWGPDSTVIPLVAGEDVARVAVGALTSPVVPPGSSYPVIGEVLSLRDMVATFGRVLGREVRYQEIPDDSWRDGALARGLNQHAVEHLSQLWRALRTTPVRFEVTDTIETLGGRRPKSFEAFVREEKSTFAAQAA